MGQNGYQTNLASEFYVLSCLFRRGIDATLTLGNKKSVDIVVNLRAGQCITIDVKAVAGKNDWLLGNSEPRTMPGHFVVLVGYEGKFADVSACPSVWVMSSESLQRFTKCAGNGQTRFVPRKLLLADGSEFKDAWHLLVASQTRAPSSGP